MRSILSFCLEDRFFFIYKEREIDTNYFKLCTVVAGGPKNNHTHRHTHIQRKKIVFLWENSKYAKASLEEVDCFPTRMIFGKAFG